MTLLKPSDLTPREIDIAALLTLPEKIAAHRLGVSISAVKFHKRNICKKTGTRNTTSAIVVLARAGILFELNTAIQ